MGGGGGIYILGLIVRGVHVRRGGGDSIALYILPVPY